MKRVHRVTIGDRVIGVLLFIWLFFYITWPIWAGIAFMTVIFGG